MQIPKNFLKLIKGVLEKNDSGLSDLSKTAKHMAISNPLEQGSPTSRISGLMISGRPDAIIIKCIINVMHLKHPETTPSLLYLRSMEKLSRN